LMLIRLKLGFCGRHRFGDVRRQQPIRCTQVSKNSGG
jgi:hypothetical protein